MKTNETVREELLTAIVRLGQLRPEWRLGQTLANLAMTAGRLEPSGVWDLEDDEALKAAQALIEQHSDVLASESDYEAVRDPVEDDRRRQAIHASALRYAVGRTNDEP